MAIFCKIRKYVCIYEFDDFVFLFFGIDFKVIRVYCILVYISIVYKGNINKYIENNLYMFKMEWINIVLCIYCYIFMK